MNLRKIVVSGVMAGVIGAGIVLAGTGDATAQDKRIR